MSPCVSKNVLLIFFTGLLGFVTSCSTGPDPSSEISLTGSFGQTGLEGTAVNSFNQFEGKRYAATDNGLYRQASADSDWNSLGLTQKEVIDVVFLPGSKMLAAVRIAAFGDNIPSMFLSADDGQNWQPYMNDYGGDTEVTWVGAIAVASQPSDTIFANGGPVARSVDGGKHWELLGDYWDAWGGRPILMESDRYYEDRIWVGGSDPFFQAYLSKSADAGESWYSCDVGSSITYDVLSFPQDKALMMVGVTGLILKSTDGCNSWETILDSINPRTLAHSARNPEVVYASGQNADGTLFFAASGNFGESWETVEWSDSPPGVQVNDMISFMENGREVLYFGTNNGVYSYRFE